MNKFDNKETMRDVGRMISRKARGKKGTGRKRRKEEIRESVTQYKERLYKEVEKSMEWHDYLELIDIGVHFDIGHAIDFAFRIGYLQGYEDLRVKTLKWVEETLGITETEGN